MPNHRRPLRADLHVHSRFSGYARHLTFLRALDCYSDPDDVYRVAKSRGMDLVTITDHDSIDGCLDFLSRHPDASDFFVSEEIECTFPDLGIIAHIGAYGIDERIHREIQPLRANIYEAVAYLRAQGVFFALNHAFFFYHPRVSAGRYLSAVLGLFDAFEVRNGAMLEAHNRLIGDMLDRDAPGVTRVGGSDAHTLRGIATTYTEAPGSTPAEFLASLRAGHTTVTGVHGGVGRVAREIYGVTARYWASLVRGSFPHLSPARRSLGLAFSAATMPFEFMPLAIAAMNKHRERQAVDAIQRFLSEGVEIDGSATTWARGSTGSPRAVTAVAGSPRVVTVSPVASSSRASDSTATGLARTASASRAGVS